MAKLEGEKISTENCYSVGYSKGLGKYVISVFFSYLGCYCDYYEITEEEYNKFGSKELDELAFSLRSSTYTDHKFLYSERNGGDEEIRKKLYS